METHGRLTRRQALVAGGTLAVGAGLGGATIGLLARGEETASAGGGSWGELVSVGDVAPVHVSLLPSGRLLMCGTDGGESGDSFPDFLADPGEARAIEVSDTEPPMRQEQDTLFCAGHAFLADGRMLQVGGQRTTPELGLEYGFLFDPASGRWTRIEESILGGPSWYPTVTRLADRRMLVVSGFVDWGGETNRTVQLFDPDRFEEGRTPWLSLVPHESAPDFAPTGADYTHTFLLPRPVEVDGHQREVVMLGRTGELHFLNYRDSFADPAERFATRPNGRRPAPAGNPDAAAGASSVMLADGRILIVGAGNEDGEGAAKLMSTAHLYDPFADTWRAIDIGISRIYPAAVLLPDGSVAVVNGDGAADGDPRRPQVIDPDSERVTTGPAWPDGGRRGYHNVALLVPDGRVLTGAGEPGDFGGRPGGPSERTDLRYYSPPYLSVLEASERPDVLEAVSEIGYGQDFDIRFENGPVHRVTLLAPGAMTHSIDMGQRCVVLFEGEAEGDGMTIRGPEDPFAAPPGHYLLFVLQRIDTESGPVLVPSVGRFVRLA